MKNILADFIIQSQSAKDLDHLAKIFEHSLINYGFPFWAYQIIRSHDTKTPPVILANYPEKWVNHYIEQRYDDIDPIIQTGPSQIMPFTWSGLCKPKPLSSKQSSFFNEAKDFGLPDGVGIPVHGANGASAMVTMANQQSPQETSAMLNAHGTEIHLIALTYHNIAKELLQLGRFVGQKITITQRERECLTWYANGKTIWEIGEILKISEATVKFHLANARSKIGVYTTKEAVVKAFMLGLIEP